MLLCCVSQQIWDLTAGKLLRDLKLHKGAVNAVEFHPHELLLASGSADRLATRSCSFSSGVIINL